MRCETTPDAGAFLDRAEGFLLRDPVVNNILITNVTARRDGAVTDPEPATYAAVFDGSGAVVGAAMRTPPFAVFLSSMPLEATAPLVQAMAAACPDAAGVTGLSEVASAFADAWAASTGAEHSVERAERLYRLDEVAVPPTPTGAWRRAEAADRDLLVTWSEAFAGEIGVVRAPRASIVADVERRIADGRAFLWVDGRPVCFVGAATPAGRVVRIAPVYTPPQHRRRGYAAALVAAASQRALDDGAALCSLYTDLANPTSNSVYMAVGYRPVGDVTAYRFAPARSAGGTRGG